MNYPSRLKSLENRLARARLDALLVTHLANIRYLCGFTGSSAVLAFAGGSWALFSDGRYTEQARLEVRGAAVRVSSLPALTHAARWTAGELKAARGGGRIGVESEHLAVAMQGRLRAEFKAPSKHRLVPTSGIVEQLRILKDPEEVRSIRKAIQLACGIFPEVVKRVDSEITENALAGELEYLARLAGAEKMSFETIVAAGQHSALPHARPTRDKLGRGFVILDYGVILGGYCSDMTRTVYAGRADQRAREIYAAVLEAQLAGISAVGPSAQAQDVDRAARRVLRKHKLDKYFTHSLGHGVGIEIHEAPRLAKGQEQKLEAGMVVTIEPGVYIPGSGGVRIEDMVLVTTTGHEVLTPTPKELLIR
jgi:Xaa-Pro aminopeptidase